MADNVSITAGTGTVIATDEVTRNATSQHMQIVKIALGAESAFDTLVDSGQQTMANSLPVVIASNQSAIPVSATQLDIDDLSKDNDDVLVYFNTAKDGSGTDYVPLVDTDGHQQVDVVASLPAGTNNIGDVDIASALPAGANLIGHVKISDGTDEATIRDVTGAKALDVAIVDGSGNQITSFGGGVQYTEADTDATITGTAIMWEDSADTLRAVSANKPLPIDVISSLPAGTNNIGDVDIASALPTGSNVIGKVKITDGTDDATVRDVTGAKALDVAIVDGSGNQITSFGGGIEYTEGDTDTTITGKAILWEDTGDALSTVSASKPLPVNIISGSSSGTEYDEDVATPATISGGAVMVERDDALSAVTPVEGDWISLRGTAEGALWTQDFNSDAILTAIQAVQTAVELIDNVVSGTEAQVDVVAPLPAGTNNIGDVDVATLPGTVETDITAIKTAVEILDNAIAGNEMQVDVLTMPTVTVNTHAVTQSGTWNIGTVTTLTTLTGSSIAHDAVDSGNPHKIGGRASSSAPTAVASGDRVNAYFDTVGRLAIFDGGTSITVDATELTTLAGAVSGTEVQVDVVASLPAGTNNIGDVDVASLPGTVASDITAIKTAVETIDNAISGTEMQVDVLTLPNAVVAGDVAHDSADSGNPIKVGGKAVNAEPTAVANGDRANFITDLAGKQIVLPYANPENFVDGNGNSTGTGDTAIISAQGAGVRIYVTSLFVNNTSATDTYVTIKDGTTAKLYIPAPANSGAIVPLPVPLRLTANTALNFASGAGVTTMYVSAVGYKGA